MDDILTSLRKKKPVQGNNLTDFSQNPVVKFAKEQPKREQKVAVVTGTTPQARKARAKEDAKWITLPDGQRIQKPAKNDDAGWAKIYDLDAAATEKVAVEGEKRALYGDSYGLNLSMNGGDPNAMPYGLPKGTETPSRIMPPARGLTEIGNHIYDSVTDAAINASMGPQDRFIGGHLAGILGAGLQAPFTIAGGFGQAIDPQSTAEMRFKGPMEALGEVFIPKGVNKVTEAAGPIVKRLVSKLGPGEATVGENALADLMAKNNAGNSPKVEVDPIQARYQADKAAYDDIVTRLTEERKAASPSRKLEIQDEIKAATEQFRKTQPKPLKEFKPVKVKNEKSATETPVSDYVKTGPKAPVEAPKPGPVVRTTSKGEPSFITKEDAQYLYSHKDLGDPKKNAKALLERVDILSRKYKGNQDALNEILDLGNARMESNAFKGATEPAKVKGALKQSIESLGGEVPKVARPRRGIPAGPKFKGGSRGAMALVDAEDIATVFRAAKQAGAKGKDATLKWIEQNFDKSGDMSGWSEAFDKWSSTGAKVAVRSAKTKEEKPPSKVAVVAREIGGLGRTLQATGDVSGSRNVKMLGAAHPALKLKTEAQAVKGTFKPQVAKDLAAEITSASGQHKKLYDAISWDKMEGLGESAEQFGSTLDKITIKGKNVSPQAAFERNFSLKTNGMRKAVADAYIKAGVADDQIESLGLAIDLLSSKGFKHTGSTLEKIANSAFFSPKAQVAKFRAPIEMVRELGKSAAARQMTPAAKLYTRAYRNHIIAGLTTLYLAKEAGHKVGTDPNSSDFGKIIVGNRRFDIWQGEGSQARIIVKALSGGYKGKSYDLTGDMGRWLRYKVSPNVNLISALVTGEDAVGKAQTPGQAALSHITPLYWKDLAEGGPEESAQLRIIAAILSAGGGVTSQYRAGEGASAGRKG